MINIYRPTNNILKGAIKISGSKSETNRLLLINKLFGNVLSIENASNSEDSLLMLNALNTEDHTIDIHHAGTAMRFLTAYYSILEGKNVVLTGSNRMKQRPIKVLVDSLNYLGAKISYLEKQGFPPLKIEGTKIKTDYVKISSNVSSQYITALMLIGSKLPSGLVIELEGKIISLPYVIMTLELLKRIGVNAFLNEKQIHIPFVNKINNQKLLVESDWSSASYYYSLVALNKSSEIKISTFFEDSLQGDSALETIYKEYFGVLSSFDNGTLHLKHKNNFEYPPFIKLDLVKTPDIAQTIAMTCVGLKMKCTLTGLETLKIKETDRLLALQNELKKLGAVSKITEESLSITEYEPVFNVKEPLFTYNDHRMAMCMAALASIYPIKIKDEEVVKKSYPNFWLDLKTLGFIIN